MRKFFYVLSLFFLVFIGNIANSYADNKLKMIDGILGDSDGNGKVDFVEVEFNNSVDARTVGVKDFKIIDYKIEKKKVLKETDNKKVRIYLKERKDELKEIVVDIVGEIKMKGSDEILKEGEVVLKNNFIFEYENTDKVNKSDNREVDNSRFVLSKTKVHNSFEVKGKSTKLFHRIISRNDYTCKDSRAINFTNLGRHKQELCIYNDIEKRKSRSLNDEY